MKQRKGNPVGAAFEKTVKNLSTEYLELLASAETWESFDEIFQAYIFDELQARSVPGWQVESAVVNILASKEVN